MSGAAAVITTATTRHTTPATGMTTADRERPPGTAPFASRSGTRAKTTLRNGASTPSAAASMPPPTAITTLDAVTIR